MTFYISLAFLVAVCTELSNKLRTNFLKLFCLFIAIVLPSFLFAVRYGIGTDYYAYLSIFEASSNGNENRIEWGYYALNTIVSKFGGEVEVAFFLVALIMFLFIYLSLSHHKKIFSPGVGMFVFMLMFYQMSFNATRQVIAMAIILYSVRYVEDRKIFKFFIVILIASGFHNSSWVFLPVYFLYNILGKWKKKYSRAILYLIILFIIFSLDKLLIPILDSNPTLDYYLKYLEKDYNNANLVFIFRYLPFIVVGIYLYRGTGYMDKRFGLYNSLFFISILLKLTILIGGKYIHRIAWDFEIILVLLIPYYIRILNKRNYLFVSWALICYVLMYWWYVYIFTGSHETYPYQWIFNK